MLDYINTYIYFNEIFISISFQILSSYHRAAIQISNNKTLKYFNWMTTKSDVEKKNNNIPTSGQKVGKYYI
jgi:hypothetical protein